MTMSSRRGLTAERLREVLDYDRTTGVFRWRDSGRVGFRRALIGEPAGSLQSNGSIAIWIDRKSHYAHRLAWLYVHGFMPPEIDHKDRVRHHNWIDNLRIATRTQNLGNASLRSNNTSGFKGVYFSQGRWKAVLRHNRECFFLGYHPTPEQAHQAYALKATELFGAFANP